MNAAGVGEGGFDGTQMVDGHGATEAVGDDGPAGVGTQRGGESVLRDRHAHLVVAAFEPEVTCDTAASLRGVHLDAKGFQCRAAGRCAEDRILMAMRLQLSLIHI